MSSFSPSIQTSLQCGDLGVVQKQVKLFSMFSALMSLVNLMSHQNLSDTWEFLGGQ